MTKGLCILTSTTTNQLHKKKQQFDFSFSLIALLHITSDINTMSGKYDTTCNVVTTQLQIGYSIMNQCCIHVYYDVVNVL
jgi:hypothetical protein